MTAPTPASRATFHALLDDALALHPEYDGGLANHLPMALHALHALGAPEWRLREFDARQRTRLRPRTAAPGDAFEARHAALASALARDGRDAVLRRELPGLLGGVAASAFHGLIRTAHAVAAAHDAELAMGLAYWAHRHAPLLPARTLPGDLPLQRWLADLQALRAQAPVAGRLIMDRMRAWAAQPHFAALAPRLAVDRLTPAGLTEAAAALYAASGNFTVLHMLTACHAMTVLTPWLDDPAAAWRTFAIAAGAALCASDARMRAPLRATSSWPPLVASAIASDDEHVVKLVHAARDLERTYGAGSFALAAARAVHHSAVAA